MKTIWPGKPPRLLSTLAAVSIVGCAPAERDHRLDFHALGTEVSVQIYGATDAQARTASADLEAYYADVGHNWYPWTRGELRRINRAFAAVEAVHVSPRLALLIRRAAGFERLSERRFNVGLGALTELWGLHLIGDRPRGLPADADIAALLAERPGAAMIEWDGDRARSPSSALVLDLGGIAKGAILEDSMQRLQAQGITDAIVNIGGDLTVLGDVRGRRARIGIRSPTKSDPIASLTVGSGETVVTSGIYERYVEIDGQRYAHILDPKTGYPVDHSVSATVVHHDAVLADAAATALIVAGSDEFEQLAAAFDLDLALLIDASGDVRLTPLMRERVDWIGPEPRPTLH